MNDNALAAASIRPLASPFLRGWQQDARAILEVLEAHHPGALSDYALVRPLPTQTQRTALRAELAQASPRLADFAQQGRRAMAEVHAVYVPEFGLRAYDVNTRSLLVYAFTVLLGDATATDPRLGRVIWDIKVRATEEDYYSTFSETDREAAYHTDTQYYPTPERALVLYCMQQAQCGGGWSSVCNAQRLREDIASRARWIDEILTSHLVPFRVPSVFCTDENPDAVQATLAPLFADEPLIRYRRDTILSGFKHFPELGHPDVLRAIEAFESELARCTYAAEFLVPDDGLMLVDNHGALHARTSFSDPRRHFLRIRMKWDDPTGISQQWPLVTRLRTDVLRRAA